jgi:outer membrane protein assembly factor BamB
MKRVLGLSLIFACIACIMSFAANESNWPYWRGPAVDGMASGDAPLHWSDTQNIKWQIDVPGSGSSSPVIWGDQIFVSTAIKTGSTAKAEPQQEAPAAPAPKFGMGRGGMSFGGPTPVEHDFVLLSYDRKSGKELWRRTAITATPHETHHGTYGSFASNSPVTDGKYVYAFFGSRGIYCYDLQGKPVWQKDLNVKMRMRMQFGEGMAPVLSGDRLILVFDQDGDQTATPPTSSFMVVLDKNTGKEIWRADRDEKTNWAAPLVVDYKGKLQIIVAATKKVRSYDFETGKEIWQCGGLGDNPIPHPVRQGDLVFLMTGYQRPNLMAIRLGREGDLTGTDAVVWSQNKGASYTPSPVIFDNKIYFLTDDAKLSCLNAVTGEPYYHMTRLPDAGSFKSSPVGVNGKLYMADESGNIFVVKMGEKFEVLATNTLKDQMFIATPAIVGGEIFLRSKSRLYCIHEN